MDVPIGECSAAWRGTLLVALAVFRRLGKVHIAMLEEARGNLEWGWIGKERI
jgi:hypothetical protein